MSSLMKLVTYFELWKNAAGYHSGPVTPSTADGAPSTVLWIRNPFLPKWTKVDGRSIFQDSDDHRSRPDDSQKKKLFEVFFFFFLLFSCLVLVGGLKKSLWCSTSWTKHTRLWFLLLFFDWFVPIYFLSLSFFLTLSVCLYFSLFTNVGEALYVVTTNVKIWNEKIWASMGFEPRIF